MDKEILLEGLFKARTLARNLAKEIDMKNQNLWELEHKHNETSVALNRMIAEKDELHQTFAQELRKMEFIRQENQKLKYKLEYEVKKMQTLGLENENLKQDLSNQRNEIEQRATELEKRESHVEHEFKKIHTEMENLKSQYLIESEYSMVLQVDDLKEELAEKMDELHNVESLNQTLILRDHMSNNELQEARKELINVLPDILDNTTIGVKRMGEVDQKPFQDLCFRRFPREDWEVKSMEQTSLWQENVKDPGWQPFKTVMKEGKLQEIIDDSDPKLMELKNIWGDGAYDSVVKALLELNDYNPSGRYVVSELWNFNEGRKASLKEVVHCIVQQLKTLKPTKRSRR
ncbi:factor of DNA methylation 2-like isoform X2 [Impatiens glandulifera]|nr:factor of DNA methylation 2-like isoform X2 [Impatiens glandulifera]XP_047330903.1 factor of DNA methylation 2-like isoform X2 [Impatiens glandulifera]